METTHWRIMGNTPPGSPPPGSPPPGSPPPPSTPPPVLLDPRTMLLLMLLLNCCETEGVPAAPVNVSVSQLRTHSAMVTWSVPQGDAVIGYAISQQRRDGWMQRSIREVNTSSRWCVLWDLDEDTHYSVQVQLVGVNGDSLPSGTVHFKTLEKTDRYPAGALEHYEPAMEGLGLHHHHHHHHPHLQTGELLIITTVLLLWAAVIVLFCRQYDIIKDSDSSAVKEKCKRPSGPSCGSAPIYHNGAAASSVIFHQHHQGLNDGVSMATREGHCLLPTRK